MPRHNLPRPTCNMSAGSSPAAGGDLNAARKSWYPNLTGTLFLARGTPMEGLKTVEELCVQHSLSPKQLAEKAGLDEQRVLAIVLGRWTPSPAERDKVAAAFG